MERMLRATAVAEEQHAWFRGLRRVAHSFVARAYPKARRLDILDCGAGTGRNLEWLSEFGRAIGVELTPLALEVGRRHGRPLIRGSVTDLPFPSAAFDLATSFDVLYCLDDPAERQALSEMYRVLRPGGRVLINAAAFDVLRGAHSTLTHEVRRYTRQRLADRLQASGFLIERLTYTNASLFVPTYLARTWERVSGAAAEASDADLQVPSPLANRTLDWILRGEARLLNYVNLPFGTSVLAQARKEAARSGLKIGVAG